MDKKTLNKLEFDKVLQNLTHYTLTEIGGRLARNLVPQTEIKAVEQALLDTEDARTLLRLKQGFPVGKLVDVSAHTKRLEKEAVLNGKELAEIGKVIFTAHEVLRFFKVLHSESVDLHQVFSYEEKLVALPDLAQKMRECLNDDGGVLDDASPTLRTIRQNIKRTEQDIRQKLDSILRTKQAQLTDALVTMRHDRYVVPVKQEYRHSFGGVVHDQSASGQTVYMEPQEVLVLNNRLRTLAGEEKQEIERILWELSDLARPHGWAIYRNNRLLGELDFLNAKALYAKDLKATLPSVSPKKIVFLYGARHPLIDQKVVVKNDIEIGEEYQAIVITGPNTGGKTILLKTLGLLQLMAQSGLHIPADEDSQVAVFSNVFAEIGDEQSIENNLSTFSSHMTNTIAILQGMDPDSLVLFDELGSGTDPQEGAALAMAILDHIGVIGSLVVATTHYPELKLYAYNRPGTINASMEFDVKTLAPTYRFLMGIPGRSNALEISTRLGLDSQIIDQARHFIDQDSQSLNAMISDLEAQRQAATKELAALKEDHDAAQVLLSDLKKQKASWDNQRADMLEQAKKEANKIVAEASQKADKIISEIRQLQLKQGQALIKEHEFIEKKTALSNLQHQESLRKNKVLQKAKRNKALKVGDQVEVMSYGQRGVIEQKLSDTSFVVKMGLLKMKVDLDDLRLIDAENPKQKQYIPTLKGARTKVTTQLDLRGQRYENAIVELDRYLDAAILAGYPQVTIVHGRGTGAVRDGVIKHLKSHRGVKSFAFAPVNQGGNGATIVQLK